MTVKELKEQLDKFPDEMEVWLTDEFYGHANVEILTVDTMTRQQWTPTEVITYTVVAIH